MCFSTSSCFTTDSFILAPGLSYLFPGLLLRAEGGNPRPLQDDAMPPHWLHHIARAKRMFQGLPAMPMGFAFAALLCWGADPWWDSMAIAGCSVSLHPSHRCISQEMWGTERKWWCRWGFIGAFDCGALMSKHRFVLHIRFSDHSLFNQLQN